MTGMGDDEWVVWAVWVGNVNDGSPARQARQARSWVQAHKLAGWWGESEKGLQ